MSDQDEGRLITDAEIAALATDDKGAVTLPLRWPFTVTITSGGQAEEKRVETVVIRRPKGKQMRALLQSRGDLEKATLDRIASCCGLERHEVDALDEYDIGVISEILDSFTQRGPATGKTAS